MSESGEVTSSSESSSRSDEKSIDEKFDVLLSVVGKLPDQEIVDTALNLLVNGKFDLEASFIITSGEVLIAFLNFIKQIDSILQAQALSMFAAILRKSTYNLEQCSNVGFIKQILEFLPDSRDVTSDLLGDILSVLGSYNLSVDELKAIMKHLRCTENEDKLLVWKNGSMNLIDVLISASNIQGPDAFFLFPGKSCAALAIPPLKPWPIQNGFTVSCWLRLDPLNNLHVETDKPYLYCLRTSKGVGYSGHFVGECLVITALKSKGKGFQQCVPVEFSARRWHHVVIVHEYSRWRPNSIRCYADGQLANSVEMSWPVSSHSATEDVFDRCLLGCAETGDTARAFTGQLGAFYIFQDSLNHSQVKGLYKLGPAYRNQFRFVHEAGHRLLPKEREDLYNDLSRNILVTYNPAAVDGNLALESSPVDSVSSFVHTPHAQLTNGVKAVMVKSLKQALHSLGGVDPIWPLFQQIDVPQATGEIDDTLAPKLIILLGRLITSSSRLRAQSLHERGFLLISQALEKASPIHLTGELLKELMKLVGKLEELPNNHGPALLRQMADYILFNPALWCRASASVQIELQKFLSTQFIQSKIIQTSLRRVSTTLIFLHALKYYYWFTNPSDRTGVHSLVPPNVQRPNEKELSSLRAYLLLFLKQMMQPSSYDEGEVYTPDEELNALTNFLLTVHEDKNILDVLQLLVSLASENPTVVASSLSDNRGIACVFKLLNSPLEEIRIHSIKLLTLILQNTKANKKKELMDESGLWALLTDRISLHTPSLTLSLYTVLFELMIETTSNQMKPIKISQSVRIINPAVLRVIANTIRQAEDDNLTMKLRILFLDDLIRLFNSAHENRKIMLQQSVWQDWLLALGSLKPTTDDEIECQEKVYKLLNILLHHSIKWEWGGWRVWVDTMALIHSSVARCNHKENLDLLYAQDQENNETSDVDEGKLDEGTEKTENVPEKDGTTEETDEILKIKCDNTEEKVAEIDQKEDIVKGKEVIEEIEVITKEKEVITEESITEEAEDATEQKEIVNTVEEEELITGENTFEETNTEKEGNAKEIVRSLEENEATGMDENRVQNSENDSSACDLKVKIIKDVEIPIEVKTESNSREDEEAEKVSLESKEMTETDESNSGVLNVEPEEKETVMVQTECAIVDETCNKSVEAEVNQLSETSTNEATLSEKNENTKLGAGQKSMDLAKDAEVKDSVTESQLENIEVKPSGANDGADGMSEKAENEKQEHKQVSTKIVLEEELENHEENDSETVEIGSKEDEQEQGESKRNLSPTEELSATKISEISESTPPLNGMNWSPAPRTPGAFRIPEFRWSPQHYRILTELLDSLDDDLNNLRLDESLLTSVENQILIHNILHLASQLADNLILATGGVLPILASATSPTFELDLVDPSQGLTLHESWFLLDRIMTIIDLTLNVNQNQYPNVISISEIENEKAMQNGGILRQFLRLIAVTAVRNSLETRYGSCEMYTECQKPITKLLKTMCNTNSAVLDINLLLQDQDVNRLRQTVYRELEDQKNSEFLALATVYLVSVLMVSKYRDILDPDTLKKMTIGSIVSDELQQKLKMINSKHIKSEVEDTCKEIKTEKADKVAPDINEVDRLRKMLAELSVTKFDDTDTLTDRKQNQISSVGAAFGSFSHDLVRSKQVDESVYEEENEKDQEFSEEVEQPEPNANDMDQIDQTDLPQIERIDSTMQRGMEDVAERLDKCLGNVNPLLRDVLYDFQSYLSKTLLGSHGQTLVPEGLSSISSDGSSTVSLVMLLCSQEWQNSIQKNAGLAFIELINEGRLFSLAMKEHAVRVGNEAEFILNRARADNVKRQADAESQHAQLVSATRREESACATLISAARRRDALQGSATARRALQALTNPSGCWHRAETDKVFWRLDPWEDDTRRRRRMVKNPWGSEHAEAVNSANQSIKEKSDKLELPPGVTPNTLPIKPNEPMDTDHSSSSINDDDDISDNETNSQVLNSPSVAFTCEAALIAPGVAINGTLSIHQEEIYWEADDSDAEFKNLNHAIMRFVDGCPGKWSFHEIRAIYSRKYLLQNTAIEIFLANRTSIMFNFGNNEIVRKVVTILPRIGIGTGYGLPQTRKISLASPRQLFRWSNMTSRWINREISNFEYLMFLNTISGRTYQDLNQYPVFPWILTNYESHNLDINDPTNYRDLSKPIGALNHNRETSFRERYESWEDTKVPRFHYGTHYSTALFTAGWLLRIEPFTSIYLDINGGKFDHPDRIFSNILLSWKMCQRGSHDVKELIPELFYLSEMFKNENEFDLGTMSDNGHRVDDVILPNWAKTPEDFVRIHRLALESDVVSTQLHKWVDLIFGYKQNGPEAVKSTNVFYFLTYENSIDFEKIQDPIEKQAVIDQIKNFGQTPSQLLVEPHAPRQPLQNGQKGIVQSPGSGGDGNLPQHEVRMVLKFVSNSPVVYCTANTHPSLESPSIVTITQSLLFSVNKWNGAKSANKNEKHVPIEPDPVSNVQGGNPKRQISDRLDQSIQVTNNVLLVMADNKHIVVAGFWDKSFRIYSAENSKLEQAVFGHAAPTTLLSRSETYIGGDCYIVSGSRDCTLLLWYWNGRRRKIVGDSLNPLDNPSPRASLVGHSSEIVSASVCAELGMIASSAKIGPVLIHTITGELLRRLTPPFEDLSASHIIFSNDGFLLACYGNNHLVNYTVNGSKVHTVKAGDSVQTLILSSDGNYCLNGGEQGRVELRDAWTLELLHMFPKCDTSINYLSLTHDQQTLISAMKSGSVVAFKIDFSKWHPSKRGTFGGK